MPFVDLRSKLAQDLANYFQHPELKASQILAELTSPPNPVLGHLALPCFRIAKTLGKANHEVTKDLEKNFVSSSCQVKAAGPYANFKWQAPLLFDKTITAIRKSQAVYGSDTLPTPQKVIIEYCSPNIAKKLAFQHIRSTLIGNVLSNVYKRLGYDVVRMNFVGDWGSQFARLLAAVELWGDNSILNGASTERAMDHLFEIYVKFHQEEEKDPGYQQLGSKWLQRLEQQDETATKLWSKIRELSLGAASKTLERMHVHFDNTEGESLYISKMASTLEDIKKKAQGRLSEGAWVVDVEGFEVPGLIQKKDGTTLYLTRDIAAAVDRESRFHFSKMLYVVSEQQKLHFQLLFGVLKKMGYTWSDKCEHVSFGTVLFGSEKMSTREGRVIFLDALLEEAKSRALVECTKKNPDLADKESVAEKVGVGAIIFGELSSHRQRDIEFNWEQMLALDGETGPYVQYSVVRCYSLLEKVRNAKEPELEKSIPVEALNSYSFSAEEEALVLTLSRFRGTLHTVVNENDPFSLPRYLIEVAKVFNRFYYRFPVLQASEPIQRQVRVQLVEATKQVLENGLELLGIQCPREM